MNYFLATSNKQLGICLRMLYAENGIQGFVETVENQKGKIEFRISINATEEVFKMLKARYKILIS